jgi:hypothetical protein
VALAAESDPVIDGAAPRIEPVATLLGASVLVGFVAMACWTSFASDAQGGLTHWWIDVVLNVGLLTAAACGLGFGVPWYWRVRRLRHFARGVELPTFARRELVLGWGTVTALTVAGGLALLGSRVASASSCVGLSHGPTPVVCTISPTMSLWAAAFGWLGLMFLVVGVLLLGGVWWFTGRQGAGRNSGPIPD